MIEGTKQRWRDWIGYYTRYGDVRELLKTTDDRYVIVNSGDELLCASQNSHLRGVGCAIS